ncbi:restriction endonuclease subunit S [Pasteurella multocida]|uniref:restriction endonuclease subunit S n=1 Tax=Pasteurella multocida TaxID=747 RepID=UPI0020212F01|nr:restriction endonuclease subunit S [Pasteurella multocida]MCL7815346.1 restriction endonuclease subunit S [Pasteurella multocida]MDY0640306.1 restriction endonuclease subunit S [Pasteurella multocida]
MNNKKSLVPKLRFPEFTDVWEQRKLEIFIQDYVEKTTVQNQYPVLTSSQKQGIVLQEDYFADRQITNENNIGYFVLPKGFFTYRSRSDNGIFRFNRNDLIDKGIISYFYPVFEIINGDSNFFLYLLNSTIDKQVALEAEGTGQRVLSLKKFKKINIIVPIIKEQQKIGTFFTALDRLITTHQRKLENVKKLKKSLLQKMFPKNGQEFPEIRFPEFTDAWEQRKLEIFIQDYVEKTTVQNQYPVLTSSQKQGIVLQEDYFADRQITNENNIGYFVLPKGFFTYRSRSDNGIFRFNRNDLIDKGIISYFYPVFEIINGDSNFFLYLLNSTIDKQVALEAEGTGQRVLSLKKFKKINIIVPIIKEQQKIGTFFTALDRLITTHQRKLENVKKLKKALLQQMFV